MPDERTPGAPPAATEGLAGGPGPTPPGFDDGTPQVANAAPETAPASGADEPPPERVARRDEEVEAKRGDPEEPDPS